MEKLIDESNRENWAVLQKINSRVRHSQKLDAGDAQTIIADVDIWRLSLTSEEGALSQATATRCGSEVYDFQAGDGAAYIEATTNTRNLILSPHLHNMVNMALGEAVEWRPATAA